MCQKFCSASRPFTATFGVVSFLEKSREKRLLGILANLESIKPHLLRTLQPSELCLKKFLVVLPGRISWNNQVGKRILDFLFKDQIKTFESPSINCHTHRKVEKVGNKLMELKNKTKYGIS